MSLNIVNINRNTPLNYGLEYRIDRFSITEACTQQIYCRNEDIESTEYPIDSITQDYYFPTTGESMQISSSDNSDNMNLLLYYYSTSTDEEPSTENITLNGQTPVNLVNNVFRVSRLVCNGNNNNGTVYLYKNGTNVTNGVPDDSILCLLRPNIGFSEQSYLYVPKTWTAFLTQCDIFNNSFDTVNGSETPRNIELYAYRLLSPLAPNLRYKVQVIPIYNINNISFLEQSAPGLTENTTYLLKAKRLSGSNAKITLTYRFVLLR
jgi:hypothetical protein